MNCEICHRHKNNQKRLCDVCAEAVQRLAGIQRQGQDAEPPKAQKLMWNAASAGGGRE